MAILNGHLNDRRNKIVAANPIPVPGEREMVGGQIYHHLSSELDPRGRVVSKTSFLRDIGLPATLKASIEAKQQAEREVLAMNFPLQNLCRKSRRKRGASELKPRAFANSSKIVAQHVGPQPPEWKEIEAAEDSGQSPNTKVVVIGNSKNGLPLILGQEKILGPEKIRRGFAGRLCSRCLLRDLFRHFINPIHTKSRVLYKSPFLGRG
jgi:hypothetical protein